MFTLLLTKLGLLHSHCVVACLCVHPTGSYFEIGWIPVEYVRVVGKAVQSIFPSNFSYGGMEFSAVSVLDTPRKMQQSYF